MGLRTQSLGQFVYDSLAIDDGASLNRRFRDYDLVQHSIEKIEDYVHKVVVNAFDLDPSGRDGLHTEAKIVARQIGQASFVVHELICSRKEGLKYFTDLYHSLSYEFQSE